MAVERRPAGPASGSSRGVGGGPAVSRGVPAADRADSGVRVGAAPALAARRAQEDGAARIVAWLDGLG